MTSLNISSPILTRVCGVLASSIGRMNSKLARRTTRISNGAKASNASGAQSYVKLILREIIGFSIAALVLSVAGASYAHSMVLASLWIPSCLATIERHRRRSRTGKRRPAMMDYLLSHLAETLLLLQWFYIVIVAFGGFFASQPVILRSIGSY